MLLYHAAFSRRFLRASVVAGTIVLLGVAQSASAQVRRRSLPHRSRDRLSLQ